MSRLPATTIENTRHFFALTKEDTLCATAEAPGLDLKEAEHTWKVVFPHAIES
jgi:hypothetical protein